MSRILKLSHLKPLAQGRMRLVFEHPEDHAMLIKVIRPDVIEKRWGSGAAWYKRRRRYGRYISYIREIQEYVAAYSSAGISLPFAQKITGLVETDMGLGLVMEAVRDAGGDLAPPLSTVILDGRFGAEADRNLTKFSEQLLDSKLIVADLNLGNLVYAHDPDGGYRFVLIDGLGGATVLPFKSLSHRFNRWSKERSIRYLRERIERVKASLVK